MPESSKIIVSAGVTRKCSIARQYPSGSGFCFSTSSPVTIKPNHSRTPKCSSTSVAFCLLPVVTQARSCPAARIVFKISISAVFGRTASRKSLYSAFFLSCTRSTSAALGAPPISGGRNRV